MVSLPTLWSMQSRGRRESNSMSTTSLEELTTTHDIVSVNSEPGNQYVVVAPKTLTEKPADRQFASTYTADMRELGSTSPSPWTSFARQEYNPELAGILGHMKYDRMRKSDGTVRGTLRSIKTPALSGRWFVEPAQEGSASQEQIDLWKKQADWIWCNLTEYMSISWPQVLTEALLMCDFGYYMFEKVWDNRVYDGEMRTVLTKLAPRHPMDVQEWKFDAHGGPMAVLMNPPTSETVETFIPIAIEKLLVFTFDREAGNIEGISVLRSAYKHWYFIEQLYKIDAIQKERHAIGIPVVKLPMGYSQEDKSIADELGRNVRTNERAHITLPPGWEVTMLKLEGRPVDALDSIEHHKAAIRENILVNFVVEGAREEDLTMFLKASRFVADIVAETFNQYLIPQMMHYNWPLEEKLPKLRVRRIGESADWRTLTFALRNLIGAGALIPDDVLEANLREEMDLPRMDKETSRLLATPQNPFDDNEDQLGAVDDGNPQGVDDRVGDGTGDQTHNQNNPNYNRKPRRKGGKKQRGQVAGLPRQSTVAGRRGGAGPFGLPSNQGGNDRSGG